MMWHYIHEREMHEVQDFISKNGMVMHKHDLKEGKVDLKAIQAFYEV